MPEFGGGPLVKAGTSLITMLNAWSEVPATLVAVTVPLKVPVALGVPESTPAGLRVNPVGKGSLVLKVGAGDPVAVKL